nr:unnamed protein product [Callosobruchus analis]
MNRHPKLTERTAEGVTPASAVVSEDNIRGWFRDIEGYLKDKDLLPILADPSRIFNGDETCFQYNPKLGKVIALKGKKNVYEVDLGKAKENLTAMFTFSASGIITPPMIIYPNKRLSSVVANEIPDEWAIGLTENGWMKSEVFIDYIKNHLHPYLRKINTKFPIILFVDGHRSHLSLELSKVCTNLEIVLIALYPNCTRIMQPADIANFRPLKSLWKRSVLQWRHKNPYCQLSKQHFAPILKTALDGLNKQYTVNGFRASGLFPWNPDALDYSKCLGKKTKIPQTSDTQMQLQCSETNCKEIVKLFDEALIKKTQSHKEKDETSIQSVFSEDEITNMPIVLLDYDETGRANHDELPNFVAHSTLSNLADEADLFSMDPQVTYSDCDIEVPNILTESELETINLSLHLSGMNPNIQTETVTFSTESGYGQIGVNSPEKRLHFEESGSSACIGTFLNLPETPVRKGSRQTERVSFVISSSAYKKNLEVKNKIKEDKEKTKNENKRKRLQKAEEVAKNKNIKRKSAKNNEKAASNEETNLNLAETETRETSLITRIERRSPMKISTTENVTAMRRTHVRKNLTSLLDENEFECQPTNNSVVHGGLCFTCTNRICQSNTGIKCGTCSRTYHLTCLQKRNLYKENFQCEPCIIKYSDDDR